jgi:hypothetical protein
MSRLANRYSAPLRIAGSVIALAGASMLGACVVQTRAYVPPPPPPPRVYVAPPVVSAEVLAPGVEVSVTATEPPPPLPDYEQPPCPDDGYLWTPGYWHYGYAGYYWVPGTWVQPPQVGVLWTPGYWAFSAGVYGFHAGYWGPHIGYYGGVNYGFGYVGVGFVGGRWEGGHYAYNTAVNNVRTTNIHNTYNETVVNNVTINKVSYNGGAGGITAAPSAQERAAAHEAHIAPTAAQSSHIQEASRNPALSAKANGGHPAIAATARPGAFTGPGVVGAHGAAVPPASNAPGANAGMHGNNLAGAQPGANGTGAKLPANQLNAAHAPPNNVAHPQALTAKPVPGKPPTLLAKRPPPKVNPKGTPPPKDKDHEPEGGR